LRSRGIAAPCGQIPTSFPLGGLSRAIASNSNACDDVTAEPSVFFVDHRSGIGGWDSIGIRPSWRRSRGGSKRRRSPFSQCARPAGQPNDDHRPPRSISDGRLFGLPPERCYLTMIVPSMRGWTEQMYL
jgi:hypothetical protein